MDKVWQELLEVLVDMLSAYQKMLELGREKRQALVAAKVADIESITKKEESLIIYVTRAEKVSKAAVMKIADHYNLPPEEIGLSKIRQFADKDTAGRLEAFERDFNKILAEIEPINKTNTELIQQALSLVNYNINLLTQNVADVNYAPQGQQGQSSQSRAIFDRKV